MLPDPSIYAQLRFALPGERWHITTRLEIIKDVAKNMENDFIEKSVVFNADSQKKVKRTPKSCRSDLQETLDEEYFVIAETMPRIVRQALFISIYALLERQLNDICEILKQDQKLLLSVSDLSGNGIFRAQMYLQKVLNIDLAATNKSWQRISNYNRLRNCFVHAGGQITSDTNKQLLKFMKENRLITVNPIKQIQLEEGFIDDVCDSIVSFINDLTELMLKRFDP